MSEGTSTTALVKVEPIEYPQIKQEHDDYPQVNQEFKGYEDIKENNQLYLQRFLKSEVTIEETIKQEETIDEQDEKPVTYSEEISDTSKLERKVKMEALCDEEQCKKIVWKKNKVFQLIELVEARPELWNVRLKEYRNRDLKYKSLEAIATSLNLSVKIVKDKIHNLRCQLNEHLRKMKKFKSGQDADEWYKPKWEFFEAVKFMSIQTNSTEDSIVSVGSAPDVIITDVLDHHDEEIKDNSGSGQTSVTNPHKRKKRAPDSVKKVDEFLNEALTCVRPRRDQLDVFGEFVTAELRGIRSEDIRKKLKLKIQRAILEANEEAMISPSNLSEYSVSSSTSVIGQMISPMQNETTSTQYYDNI
ncbi:uncharacterized protein LOC113391236 [Ctenocephalides felis]|uniref:uncharacterized protein LOC113391236 n=1 Tax=Ctenocephalides felis TaxID=7515 RepID=UPI000E6E3746|nr:uncharacterized protein LOC113391236 [Ctenocephalides felis]